MADFDPDKKTFPFEDLIRYVDATPDGQYALRLLRTARQWCDGRFSTMRPFRGPEPELLPAATTLSVLRAGFINKMRELDEARARELDKAIQILERETNG